MSNNVEEEGEPTWDCRQCKEEVPESLDVCWNCGTHQDGTPDPNFVREPLDELAAGQQLPTPCVRPGYRCPTCGSTKLIPDTWILDQGQGSDHQLYAVVLGNPDALVFKERVYGALTADICGDCGHADLKVNNPDELYRQYLRSLR